MISSWDDTRKELAKRLFGRALRVALADWIADRNGDSFFLQEAQFAMLEQGEAASAVATELRRFVEVEMLTETRDANRVYFTATISPLWAAFEAVSIALSVRSAELATRQSGQNVGKTI